MTPGDRVAAFRRLARGETSGLAADLLRGGLRILSWPYAGAVATRNALFDMGWRTSADLGVPTISVGNLTTGGTGKTPLVAEVCRRLQALGRQPGVLSRGYGANAGGANDEAAALKLHLPDVPHAQGADRTRHGRRLVAERRADVLVLDDGFQHRQVRRNLDIVLIDATDPWGTALLPRGFGREPRAGLKRADVVALTRADLVSAATRDAVRREVARHAPRAAWAEISFAPDGWFRRDATGVFAPCPPPVAALAFCGLGNPAGFLATLQSLGLEVRATRAFPDHHHYRPDDLSALSAAADAVRAESFAVTEKDAVKLPGTLAGRPVAALRIAARFLVGEAAFAAALANAAAIPASRTPWPELRSAP